MKNLNLAWLGVGPTRTDEEWLAADMRVEEVRAHLRSVLNDLTTTLDRIEDKQQRGMPQ